MSEYRRTNITISDALYEKAQELMRLRHFTDFSGYLQQLIREDWERRGDPLLHQYLDQLTTARDRAIHDGRNVDALEHEIAITRQRLSGNWVLNDARPIVAPAGAKPKRVSYRRKGSGSRAPGSGEGGEN